MTDADPQVVSRSAICEDRLLDYFRREVDPAISTLTVNRVDGGQSNPTFIVQTDCGRFVVRRKPNGVLLPSAHAIEREYRVLAALAGSNTPVPSVRSLCEDVEIFGGAFFVMDFVEGRILGDQTLPGCSPQDRRRIYEDMAAVLAGLHALDHRALGLGDYGREAAYIPRQINRWTRQYRASETRRIEAMERLIAWLPHNAPDQSRVCLVHGDYRLDNVILHPTEPRIVAVLDWELSTLGDPLADIAYHCMTWQLPLGAKKTLAGVDPAPLNIPTEAEQRDLYCRFANIKRISDWEFYMAFNMFRMAAIQQGIAKRSLDGNSASAQAATSGARTEQTATLAWQAAERVGA